MGTEARDRAVEGRSEGYPEMGAIVTVHAEFVRVHQEVRAPRPTPPEPPSLWAFLWRSGWAARPRLRPRAGWVVGRRWIQEGYNDYSEDIGGSIWRETGPRTPCILVAFWPTYKPVRVPLDGWTPGGEPRPSMTPWTNADRKMARQAVADQPRDARGRWMKWE